MPPLPGEPSSAGAGDLIACPRGRRHRDCIFPGIVRLDRTIRPAETVEAGEARIPRLGLGTWQLEGERCRRAVEEALVLGYRHLDTAAIYGNEEEVGRGLRSSGVPRDEVFVTTKVWHDRLDRDGVRRSAEESLERLGLAAVDLLLVHWPSEEVPLPETLEAMERLREQGRIHHLGVSNFPPELLQEALAIAPVVCDQVEYHLHLRQPALCEAARRRRIALVAYSPLGQGKVPEDPDIVAIARELGATPAQVALRWLVEQEPVAAIPKASSRAHLEENLGALELRLDPEIRARLDALGGPTWT